MQRKKSKNWQPVILLAPAIIIVILIIGYPVGRAIGLSLFQYDMTNLQNVKFVGIQNYVDLFTKDEAFWPAFKNTVVWVLVTVASQLLLSLLLANILNKKFFLRGVVRSIVLIPWVTPCVLISLMWAWIFNGNYGVVNEILNRLHLITGDAAWLAQPQTALWVQILAMIWQGVPFFTIMILAAMQSIPAELYESASVDGASSVRKYFHITIPGIASTLVSTVMIRLIWVFNNVDIIYTMTGGGPGYSSLTLSVYTYQQAQKSMRFGYGSAAAITGAVFMTGVIFIYLRLTREKGGMITK
ncbi:MAG: sugar ABC transporter permease [Lachnospiraceae bacterium]|jgi:multiple sugar transport system permease protein|nr:sugar ABC transporter permease [Lachnospiraceae bacterium]